MQRLAPTSSPQMRSALAAAKPGLIGAGVLTGALVLLPLAGALYVMMVLDVALVSRSGATLVGLFGLAAAVFAAQAWLLSLRDRIFAQIGEILALRLGGSADEVAARAAETGRAQGVALQLARDLDGVRSLLAGRGPAALADLPASAVLLLVVLALHGFLGLVLGTTLAAGAAILVVAFRGAARAGEGRTALLSERDTGAEVGGRHAGLLRMLGMSRRAADGRAVATRNLIVADAAIARDTSRHLGIVRCVRMVGVAAILATGAWLAVTGRASAGALVAAALLADRALRPFEEAIAAADEIAAARLGWARIAALLAEALPADAPLPLPAPTSDLSVEAVSLLAPDNRRVVLRDISFALRSGEMLSVVGPSGSGKSALLRALAGGWPPVAGRIRLDGGALDQWTPDELGRHVGYLGQIPELFEGTVEQNIGRFDPQATSERVIAAAMAAGVHDLIVRLPNGYATALTDGGANLALGQRQRIALARALYGNPFLLLLDDPASFADARGQAALTQAVTEAKARGAIIVATGAANAALEPSDYLLVLGDGQRQDFGPKAEVRGRLVRRRAKAKPIAAPAAEPLAQE